ncbi:MAG TPA: alpha/beta hydrolase [Chloroflexi bacterium]|nr:alpha/beta hydrolase [Chloroflexota bacterium]HHW86511.1 alpha/beta hydrolase [Chloroflexota bacterium]
MQRVWLIGLSVLLAALLMFGCAPVVDLSNQSVTLANGVVGTLNRPAGADSAPVVLMLHGFGSSKDEVGGMYARLADALAQRGIGSLRIDFRGFGKSDGDTGATTVGAQVEDAVAAYEYLANLDWVDPQRIGVIGFSLGGGVATIAAAEHPDFFKSMVTWSSVGDMTPDFIDSLGQEAFDTAAEKGVVGLDLGWRTIVLKQDFFESLAQYDLAQLITAYPGAYLAIAGDQDFSAAYAPSFVESAQADPKAVWIVPGGDHIFGVLTDDQTMADSVIERTAQWFAETL